MTDWKVANLDLRAARDAMDAQKRAEAERDAARRTAAIRAGRLTPNQARHP